MKVKCNRARLSDAIQLASGVVPTRTTMPVLSNLKFRTLTGKEAKEAGAGKGDFLEVTATDLEMGVRCFVSLEKADASGTLVLPAARISGIVRENTDETITVEADGTLGRIVCADSQYKVIGVDPAEYPQFPDFDAANAVSISAVDFREMVRKTSFAVSTEMVRYALTGLLMEITAGKTGDVRMVASDGKRLAYIRKKRTGKETGSGKGTRILVPPKALRLVEQLLTDDDESVAIQVEETQVKMMTLRGMVFSRLIEGNFPDYEAVIPKDVERKISLDMPKFLVAVRKAALMTSEKARAVKLSFSKGKLTLLTRTQDIGEAKIEAGIDYAGDDLDVVFNPDFLIDFAKVAGEGSVEFSIKDSSSAGAFRIGKDYAYVVMPLAVNV